VQYREVNQMPTIKREVISLVKRLPENSTLEEIMEHLYVKQKILKGQRQLETGQFYTHEEAKKIMKKWLR
jgi:predicted transcriptional regulator